MHCRSYARTWSLFSSCLLLCKSTKTQCHYPAAFALCIRAATMGAATYAGLQRRWNFSSRIRVGRDHARNRPDEQTLFSLSLSVDGEGINLSPIHRRHLIHYEKENSVVSKSNSVRSTAFQTATIKSLYLMSFDTFVWRLTDWSKRRLI